MSQLYWWWYLKKNSGGQVGRVGVGTAGARQPLRGEGIPLFHRFDFQSVALKWKVQKRNAARARAHHTCPTKVKPAGRLSRVCVLDDHDDGSYAFIITFKRP